MANIKLLDCTLRDGGYLNNWCFGKNSILCIIQKLQKGNIDIVELGYMRDYDVYNLNRSIFPDTLSIKQLLGNVKKTRQFSIMLDFGHCSIDKIADKDQSIIDIIRLTFRKKQLDEALEYSKQLIKKGYLVFLQPVSITSYTDKEILELVEKTNIIDPYGISIVDSYGLMHKENMIKYFYLMDNNLHCDIRIGYHSHNNFQLGYSNSIEFIEMKTKRELILDGSLFGMGKSAGNTCIELLAMYMNENYNTSYNINEILELIDLDIMKYKKQYDWGYSLPYFISASNDCHPNYVQYLKDKNTLAVKSINDILKNIEPSKKLVFNKEYIENLYIKYQNHNIDDTVALKILSKEMSQKNILLLGPGRSVIKQKDDVLAYINKKNPIIISLNHVPSICKPDYLFISNTKRYEHYVDVIIKKDNDFKIIATSNIIPMYDEFDYVLNYGKLLNKNELIGDNSMSMLITAFTNMKVNELALAGLDGFNSENKNYYDDYLKFSENNKDAYLFNEVIAKQLANFEKYIKIVFLTESAYEKKRGKLLFNVSKTYKAVIFDVDGTILNPKEGVTSAIKFVIKKAGLNELSDAQLNECVGPPIQNSLKRFYSLDDSEVQKITEFFRARYKEADLLKAKVYDGIFEVMKELKRKKIKIGIATYKRQDYAEKLLKHFGFDKYCDSICGADNNNKYKKVDIIKNCLKELEISSNNAVMIGDTLHDALGAEEIKMDFIAVTYGFGFKDKSQTLKYKPVYVAPNVQELNDYFSRKEI